MAFIIPNATDTASGAKYENLDQAEPDSLDFEILGNAGYSGVLSGCEVTALAASNTSVSFSGGVIVLGGQPYIVSGQASFALPAAPTDARFDLIVVRVVSGTASLVAVVGNDELTNPEFPKSVNSLATGVLFNPQSNIDFTTDVVLASVYRQGNQNITTSRIADRRMMVTSSIVDQGTTAPSSGSGYKGSLYYRNNVIQGTTSSGVYVKNSVGTWIELAQNTGPQVPVGSLIAWLGTGSIPSGYLEANGQTVSRTTYSELFGIFGTSYGAGDGSTTFALPNLNGKHLKGTSVANSAGTDIGNDTVSLTVANLPSHSHSLAGHTHTVSHSHTMAHNHNASTDNAGAHFHTTSANGNTSNTGSHAHTDGNYAADPAGTHSHTLDVAGNSSDAGSHNHEPTAYTNLQFSNSEWLLARRTSVVANPDGLIYVIPSYNSYPGTGMVVTQHIGTFTTVSNHTHADGNYSGTTSTHNGHSHGVSGNSGNTGAHFHTVSTTGNTSNTGAHVHTVTVASSNAASTGTEVPTTSASNVESGTAGSGATFNNVPASTYVRWIVRATGSTNATAQDGVQILAEAREEVVTIELSGSGALPASQTDAAYFRMPWAATLTGVKANRNGVNTNGSVTIDVNEGGVSVLSTLLTIDQNESSSLTADTPVVISDNNLANDALLTFDIDSANTSDEGPLTVTLYFTRED
jgi:microcystin-dependent protein